MTTKDQLKEIIARHERVFPLSATQAQHCTPNQFDNACELYNQGYTIPSVVEEVGIPYDVAEIIIRFQLHTKAVERHNPARCQWCIGLVEAGHSDILEDEPDLPLPDDDANLDDIISDI